MTPNSAPAFLAAANLKVARIPKRPVDELDVPAEPPPAKRKVCPIFSKRSETSAAPEPDIPFQWKSLAFLPSTCLHGINLKAEIRPKIAAFDLDGTVVSKLYSYCKQEGNIKWNFLDPDIPRSLKKAHDSGHTVVFCSTYYISGEGLVKLQETIGRVAEALHEVPFLLFISTNRSEYRKPNPGMWVALERLADSAGVVIDKKSSFYVGDDAGRKGDDSSVDRKFADNIEIKFYTPEVYFLKKPPLPYKYEGTRVGKLHKNKGPRITPTCSPTLPIDAEAELVLFVGPPASGKTTLFESIFLPAGYERVNQDTLGDRSKCLKEAEEFLRSGKSCVIDNANRDEKTRHFYIKLAEKLDISVRCFVFEMSTELARHNCLYRAFCLPLLTGSPATEAKDLRKLLPYGAIDSFFRGYEKPTVDEGFHEVKTVNWQFEGNAEEERYWKMWLSV